MSSMYIIAYIYLLLTDVRFNELQRVNSIRHCKACVPLCEINVHDRDECNKLIISCIQYTADIARQAC